MKVALGFIYSALVLVITLVLAGLFAASATWLFLEGWHFIY